MPTTPTPTPVQTGFQEILAFIYHSRYRALQAVNTGLLDLYWRIGEDISHKIQSDGWGQGTLKELAAWIQVQEPWLHGFSAPDLYGMIQLYETYRSYEVLSPLVRDLTWTHNILILNKCKSMEERIFYLRLTARERWGKRDLERQINGGLFERSILGQPRITSALGTLPSTCSFFTGVSRPWLPLN
jgi:predicted nuclease of restriction endonuclease-like (RecB) superfamily